MLDILSSPLRGYIAQNLQFYLSKYIEGIQLEGLGLFGGDLVLNDLEIKRHVLAESLDIPSSFDFSRGFIRELRIHIPWTQLLSQPIEVKLYTIELILTARDDARSRRASRSRSVETPPAGARGETTAPEIENPKSGWLRDTLHKILMNLTIQINNLVLKYKQDDMVLSVALGTLDCYAVNEKSGWSRAFTEPEGPRQVIYRAVEARDLTIFLDRYTSDRQSRKASQLESVHRRVIGYELPVLNRSTFSIRCKFVLKPDASEANGRHKRLQSKVKTYRPSYACDPFFQYSCDRKTDAPTTEIDVFISELSFSLSDRQIRMLGEFIQRTTKDETHDVYEGSSSTIQRPSGIEASDLVDAQNSRMPDQEDSATTSKAEEAKGSWLSWAMETLGGPQNDEDDELISEILAETKEALRRSSEAKKQQKSGALKQSTVATEGAENAVPLLRTFCCRLCINSTILTLRKHEDRVEDEISTGDDEDDKNVEEELVPVANVGLVKVSKRKDMRPKLSKPAAEVCSLALTYTAIEVLVTRSEDSTKEDTTITDLVFEVERVKVSLRQPNSILSWGEALESEQQRSGSSSQFTDCVSHPYFVSSFFGEDARRHGRQESRSFELVKVSQDMAVPVWRTVERRKSTIAVEGDAPKSGSCACYVFANGRRVPCAPMKTLHDTARSAIAQIGIYDRQLGGSALRAALEKSWVQHFGEHVDLSSLLSELEGAVEMYRALRDPDLPAGTNLSRILLPALSRLLARHMLHTCETKPDPENSNGGFDRTDFRTRSVHSAVRLRYVSVSSGTHEQSSPCQKSSDQKGEDLAGHGALDVSLGPMNAQLHPGELAEVVGLLGVLKSTEHPNEDSSPPSSISTVDPATPLGALTRLVTLHSLNIKMPIRSPIQDDQSCELLLSAKSIEWQDSRVHEQPWPVNRKLSIEHISVCSASGSSRPVSTSLFQSRPMLEIVALTWTSRGGQDDFVEATTVVSFGRVSAVTEPLRLIASIVGICAVLNAVGARVPNVDVPSQMEESTSPLFIELCKGEVRLTHQAYRHGLLEQRIDAELHSCALYSLKPTGGLRGKILEVGDAPISIESNRDRRPAFVAKLRQSWSDKRRFLDVYARISPIAACLRGLNKATHDVHGVIEAITGGRRSEPRHSDPSTRTEEDSPNAWVLVADIHLAGMEIILTSALRLQVSAISLKSEQATDSNGSTRSNPQTPIRVILNCEHVRLLNKWRRKFFSAQSPEVEVRGISLLLAYNQTPSLATGISLDVGFRIESITVDVNRSTIKHILQVEPQHFEASSPLNDRVPTEDSNVAIADKQLLSGVQIGFQVIRVSVGWEGDVTRTSLRDNERITVSSKLEAHAISVAFRQSPHIPKIADQGAQGRLFKDIQFSVGDIVGEESHVATDWSILLAQERRFGNLARLSHHDFTGIMLCLDSSDLQSTSEAVGCEGFVDSQSSTMAAWQAVNKLARHFQRDSSSRRSSESLRRRKLVSFPIIAMSKRDLNQTVKPAPVLSFFYRNYGEGGELQPIIAASMEAVDIAISQSFLVSLTALLDLNDHGTRSSERSSDKEKRERTEFREQNTSQPVARTEPSVSFLTSRIRVFLPDDEWVQYLSTRGQLKELPPQCLCFGFDAQVTSPSIQEISLDGLNYPPFNTTLLPRRALRAPQLRRLASNHSTIRKTPFLTGRVGDISGALVKWARDSESGSTSGPIDRMLEEVVGFPVFSQESEAFIRPFSVSVTQESLDHDDFLTSISLTKLRAEVPKNTFDHVFHRARDIQQAIQGLQVSINALKRAPSNATLRETTNHQPAFQLDFTSDGVELIAVVDSVNSIHARCGSCRTSRSLSLNGVTSSEVALQNLVIAHREKRNSSSITEALVLGPNTDPVGWQLNVENTPRSFLSGRWTTSSRSDSSSLDPTAFIDVHGFQLHASSHILDSAANYLQPTTSTPRGYRHERAVLEALEREAIPTSEVVRSSTRSSVKVLVGPSVVSMCIYRQRHKEADQTGVALWCNIDQVFTNVDFGYDAKDRSHCLDTLKVLDRVFPLQSAQVTANIERISLRTSSNFTPITLRFKADTLSAIPGQVVSTWNAFSKLTKQVSATTSIVNDCSIRLYCSHSIVVERYASALLLSTPFKSTLVQLDASSVQATVSTQSWESLQTFIAGVTALRHSSSPSADDQEMQLSSTSAPLDVGLMSDDDLANLHHRTQSGVSAPCPGDVVFSESMLIETASGFDLSINLRNLDMTVDFEPSRGARDPTAETFDFPTYDEAAEVLHWIELVNAPWGPVEAPVADDELPLALSETQTISWMSMKWCYRLPRKIAAIDVNPVPVPPTGPPKDWPKWHWKEEVDGGDADHFTRLCDIICQLRVWDRAQKRYVVAAEFFAPWENSVEARETPPSHEPTGSFGDIMSIWFDAQNEQHEHAKFARVVEVTSCRRLIRLKTAYASDKWELRWRSPLSGEQDKHRRLHVSALLAASLKIRSIFVPEAIEQLIIHSNVPRVGLTLAYVEEKTEVSHDVMSVEVQDLSLSLLKHALEGGSKMLIKAAVQVSYDNFAQMTTVPILPPVTVHGQVDHSSSRGTDVSILLGTVHMYLPQSAILLLSSIPQLLSNRKPSKRPDGPLKSRHMRIQLVNECGQDLLFRQHSTSESLRLDAHKREMYSWLTLDGDPFYDCLQFAVRGSSNDPQKDSWCDPCRIREQIVTGRYFPGLGFLWIQVERHSTGLSVILRGGFNAINHTTSNLQIQLLGQSCDHPDLTELPVECPPSRDEEVGFRGTMIASSKLTLKIRIPASDDSVEIEGEWSNSIELADMPSEFDPVSGTQNTRSPTVRCVSVPTSKGYRWFMISISRVSHKVAMPDVFDSSRVCDRYTWTELHVYSAVRFFNYCDSNVQLALHSQDREHIEFSQEPHAVHDCDAVNPAIPTTIKIVEGGGPGNGSVLVQYWGCTRTYRLGSISLDLVPASPETPFIQVVLRNELTFVNNTRFSLIVHLSYESEGDQSTHYSLALPPGSHLSSGNFVDSTNDSNVLVAVQSSAKAPFVSEAVSSRGVPLRIAPGERTVIQSEHEDDSDETDLFTLPLVATVEKSSVGCLSLTFAALVSVHNDTDFPLEFAPGAALESPTECGDTWTPLCRIKRMPLKSRTTSGATLTSWISSALSFGGSSGRIGRGSDDRGITCSFKAKVAATDAGDELFYWSEDIEIKIPDLQFWPASSRALYPPPANTASRHRLLMRHSHMAHLMVTYTVSQLEDGTIHVLLFVDHQPPVSIKNNWFDAIGFRMISSEKATPDLVGGNHCLEYDWSLQLRGSRVQDLGDCADVAGQWLESSAASFPNEETPQYGINNERSLKFQLGLPEYGWSNTLWQVPGIQFARFSLVSSADPPVFLVVVSFRAGTWVISLSSLTDSSLQSSIEPPLIDGATGVPELLNRFRFAVSSESVQVHCCDEHSLSVSEASPTAIQYDEILRLTLERPCVSFVSTSEPPEMLKTASRLGYLKHVRGYNFLFVGLERVGLDHFFENCDFPTILEVHHPDSSGGAPTQITADLNTMHVEHSELWNRLFCKELPQDQAHGIALRAVSVDPLHQHRVAPYYHAIEFRAAPTIIQVDDEILHQLQTYTRPISDSVDGARKPTKASLSNEVSVWREDCLQRIRVTSQQRFFVERLDICSLELTVTARMSIPVLNSLDGTPLRFSARQLGRVFAFPDQLLKDLAAEYVADIIVRSPYLLMSLNIIGNPAGLCRSIGTGVRDLFEMPISAASRDGFNPWIIMRGVVSGVGSLVGHTSAAALSSLSGFSYSISRTVDHLTLTPEQVKRRHYVRPTRLTSGIAGGLGSLGSSVVGAATGIVSTPIALYHEKREQGLQAGVSDVVGGFGMGLVGILARPMGGLASLLAMTSDGILYSTGFSDQILRDAETKDSTAFEVRPNEVLRAKLKVLRDPSLRQLALAHGAWLDPSEPLMSTQVDRLRVVSQEELADGAARELFSTSDKSARAVLVTVICTPATLFVVGMPAGGGGPSIACNCEVIARAPLVDIIAIEESLTEAARLEIAVRALEQTAWIRLRLVPSQRRGLSHHLRKWFEEAHNGGD